MWKELEAIGLQGPEYRNNAFMLQTIIRSNAALERKPQFEKENHGLDIEKPRFEKENHGFDVEKPRFEWKEPLLQMIDDAVYSKELTPIIAGNVKRIIEIFEPNQIFGRKEIKKELGYGDYKAGKAIEAMQMLNIVIPVAGKGKGKYMLKEMQGIRRCRL